MISPLFAELALATGETLYMVIISTFFATLLGLPLGTYVFIHHQLTPHPWIYRALNIIINLSRSIPFIILLVALLPLTRILVGTSIGVHAAIVPLTLGATPLVARLVENAYLRLPSGLIETGKALGASVPQMIQYLLLPEAKPAILQTITLTAITLTNYSAMAGTVGGGGLGDLAIRYGYQRFDTPLMVITVLLLIVIVQSLQWLGDRLTFKLTQGHSSCAL